MKDIETENLTVKIITVGEIGTNCCLAFNKKTKEGFLVDPGAQAEKILKIIEDEGAIVKSILLTHGHFDHIMAVNTVKEKLRAEIYVGENEEEMLMNEGLNASGIVGTPYIVGKPEHLLKDGQKVELAGVTITVIETPGHTSGGVCYYISDERLLFCGDTLFMESAGRTDLPTGNGPALMRSLREKIRPLPDDVTAIPGHGPKTNLGYEKQYNPYL